MAHALVEATGRAHRYAAINVAGVAPGVFESQLFGYVPGAYSGSGKGSPGVFVAHDKGSVFLDEIGELPLELQAKLLRVLDNREVVPVGAVRPVKVDVVVIAATNRSLVAEVERGSFRRDLLARLSMATVRVPPLRNRAEDIFSIAQALASARGEHLVQVEVEAVERLMLHAWPSNVRELAGILERAAMTDGPGTLRLRSVEPLLGGRPSTTPSSGLVLTAAVVRKALADCGGNESEAARRLGVSRGKLRRFVHGSED